MGKYDIEAAEILEPIEDIPVNENQLWFLFIGLERLKLADMLSRATNDLAARLHAQGVRQYDWVKLD